MIIHMNCNWFHIFKVLRCKWLCSRLYQRSMDCLLITLIRLLWLFIILRSRLTMICTIIVICRLLSRSLSLYFRVLRITYNNNCFFLFYCLICICLTCICLICFFFNYYIFFFFLQVCLSLFRFFFINIYGVMFFLLFVLATNKF